MTVSNFLTWIKAFRRGTVHLSKSARAQHL
jgi:hypothetical protein